MGEIIIHQIQNRTKIEALIGLSITALIGLMSQKIYIGESIPVEIFWGLALLGVYYFVLELMSYVKFYIEKMVYLKEQSTISKMKTLEVEVECRRLEHMITLKRLEVPVVA